MGSQDSSATFSGSIPEFYEKHLVPLIFQPYAIDIDARLQARAVGEVLETAAGTGVVTRELARVLPASSRIVATDVSQQMVDVAVRIGAVRPVEWRQADATALPYADKSFDAVLCQFGLMFFADKVRGLAAARRVLRPGGVFICNVWDRIEENEFVHTVSSAVADLFRDDPPHFLERTSHGYHHRDTIAADLAAAGFPGEPRFDTVAACSRADSARAVAVAYCEGTPLRAEIEARDPRGLEEAIEAATEAIARGFGRQAVEGKIQAHVVTVEADGEPRL